MWEEPTPTEREIEMAKATEVQETEVQTETAGAKLLRLRASIMPTFALLRTITKDSTPEEIAKVTNELVDLRNKVNGARDLIEEARKELDYCITMVHEGNFGVVEFVTPLEHIRKPRESTDKVKATKVDDRAQLDF